MFNDYNLPDGCRVRDLPGFGREPGEHSAECLRANRRLSHAGEDTECICHVWRRELDQVETGSCENCHSQFEIGELAVIPEIDPDLKWCEACRAVCECGHILGVHAIQVDEHLVRDGCDGNHGEPGECDCRGFVAEAPRAVVDRAKGIWISESFRRQMEREHTHV